MGKIFRRGIDFSGGGGSISNPTASSVTFNNTDTGLAAANVQDAITEVNGKSADCIKYNDTKSVKEVIDEIKASSSSNPTAASVTFDNANTGLAATNVQDAVTEVNGKLPKYIDITAKCPASTWCNIALPDVILSVNNIINVHRPNESDSNVYGIIWWPSANKRITILRINTNGTNLTVDNTEKTIKLRIWFC